MNNESNLVDLRQRREQARIEKAVNRAKLESCEFGYEKAKRRYTGIVWALALYGIGITTAYFTR